MAWKATNMQKHPLQKEKLLWLYMYRHINQSIKVVARCLKYYIISAEYERTEDKVRQRKNLPATALYTNQNNRCLVFLLLAKNKMGNTVIS